METVGTDCAKFLGSTLSYSALSKLALTNESEQDYWAASHRTAYGGE